MPVTPLTLAEAVEASDEVDWAAITFWNCAPFSSSDTRLAVDDLAEKKVSQFAAIVPAAPDIDELPVGEDAGEDADGVIVVDEPALAFGLEPPHPATRAPSPTAISGATALPLRNVCNRTVSVSLLSVILLASEEAAGGQADSRVRCVRRPPRPLRRRPPRPTSSVRCHAWTAGPRPPARPPR